MPQSQLCPNLGDTESQRRAAKEKQKRINNTGKAKWREL